jgi:hypothetical protein
MANADLAGPLEKGKTRKQLKAARARLQAKVERVENEKVVARSGGRCEVWYADEFDGRCIYVATQIHHMLGCWRMRGKGQSALAKHKQHVCAECHRAITGDVNRKLIRVGGPVPYYADWYRRAV